MAASRDKKSVTGNIQRLYRYQPSDQKRSLVLPIARSISPHKGASFLNPMAESRKERHAQAQSYRETYLLPRFVREENGGRRKLEAGEYDPQSSLYPLSTPISEMSDFGKIQTHIFIRHSRLFFCDVQAYIMLVGIGLISLCTTFTVGIGISMYFNSTLWFGSLMFFCGLCQLPVAVYFSSASYDKSNDQDSSFKAGVSR
jgi:hypothetical protein